MLLSSILFAGAIRLVLALPRNPTDPSTSAVVDKGTFANPSKNVRPKFRYWIPDASVNTTIVAQDVKSAGDIGAGGLELLGYYLYGGPPSNGAGRGSFAPVDWAEYGFGTPAWHDVFKAFVQATKDNDLIMDFAMGPNQGAGVPAAIGTEGLAVDLSAFNVTVPVGGSFDGVLPGWGTGKLQAAVSGTLLGSQTFSATDAAGGLPGDLPSARTQYTLSAESLTDVTDQVDGSGQLNIDFSSSNDTNKTGENHIIFAVYLYQSLYREQQGPLEMKGPQSRPASWVNNGSWVVDHFSSVGARLMTKFWEDYILNNGTRELLSDVGNYGWEDSVELDANVYWTKNFSAVFEQQHKYSIDKWLPILFHRNGHAKNSNPGIWYVTDEPDQGNAYIADYRDTLASQYRIYEKAVNDWLEDYLSLQFSAQLSYNLPMDMLANIPSVDAPETESLDFSDLIDGYRQYSGPANLAQRRIVSSECGAVRGEAYVQTLPELLWKVKRSYAGSLNQFVFHGFPYSGQYGNTTWPSWSTFNYQYSEQHGPHQPAWEFYKDQFDFIARNNWVFQSGVPRIDVAIWQKITVYPGHVQLPTYAPTDLEEAGYSYEYLSPDNLDLPAAKVSNGILAPDAQAFKAMVVRANDSLTLDGVSKIVEFAHAGLPIIFAGGIPSSVIGTIPPTILRQVQRDLNATAQLPNVHVTSSYFVASTLASIGIEPMTKVKASRIWNTYWRSDLSTDTDYVLVYNDAMYSAPGTGQANGTVEFRSTKIPYEYDAWTGEKRLIRTYTTTNTSTVLPLTLAGNQSIIVAFVPQSDLTPTKSTNLVHVVGGVLGTVVTNNTTTLKIGAAASFSTSDGLTRTVPAPLSSPFQLSNWTLIAEHWDPPADLYNYANGAVKYNTTHHLSSLISWLEIPGLQNTSGRGYYSTSFSWPPTSVLTSGNTTVAGAFIDFGYVYHTLQASVNGHRLPPLDVTQARTDIKDYLIEGINQVEAVVSTPLGNVLIPIWNQLMSSGEGPGSPDAGSKNGFVPPPLGRYGLLSDVLVTPYIEVELGS